MSNDKNGLIYLFIIYLEYYYLNHFLFTIIFLQYPYFLYYIFK